MKLLNHQVEQEMRRRKRVEDFQDFVKIVDSCGKSLLMDFSDFFEIPKGLSQAKYTCNKPKLENVQLVKFFRGSVEMFWKTSYAEKEFKSSRFLQTKHEKNIGKDFERNKQNRGVKPEKKDNIIEALCPHMKERSRQFWHQLAINEASVDLITERDESFFISCIQRKNVHYVSNRSIPSLVYLNNYPVFYLIELNPKNSPCHVGISKLKCYKGCKIHFIILKRMYVTFFNFKKRGKNK